MAKIIFLIIGCTLLISAFGASAFGQSDVQFSPAPFNRTINCDEVGRGFCLDRVGLNYEGEYVGHDEPSVLFYSNAAGSGNHTVYQMILPVDPKTPPKQDGTGGTFNFQLHPAFWFGMAICDTQSAPNPDPSATCVPDSDANIFDNTNSRAPDYIGKHPGTAFLELQFYPPGWIGSPGIASSNRYFSAINIDSYSFNQNTRQNNNLDCLNNVGQEPVNFAIITRNGVPLAPANPLGAIFGSSNSNLANVLLMSPGDVLRVEISDSPGGVMVTIQDLTNGQSGTMIGGPAAGFGQVNFAPTAKTCSVTPYAFHPMYSSSSEHTRVPWAAHSYNIAFADEIGHFELCNAFNMNPNDPRYLTCTAPGAQDAKLDSDDAPCANPSFFGFGAGFQNIIGCVGEDLDFDGAPYGSNWPGTGNPLTESLYHSTPIQFTSPKFPDSSGKLQNYERAALETDLPAFEADCDTHSGSGCTNLPKGAQFYPVFSTVTEPYHQCWWQLGGGQIQGTLNNFGGTADQYGELYRSAYPSAFGATFSYENFHRTFDVNPCQTP